MFHRFLEHDEHIMNPKGLSKKNRLNLFAYGPWNSPSSLPPQRASVLVCFFL